MNQFPQLWTSDLPGLIGWAQKVITYFQAQTPEVGDEAPVTSESAGMARVWLGSTVPSGWVLLDGSYIFINEAPELYAIIGLMYDAVPPAGMFKLPPAPTAVASGIWIAKR